MRCHPAVLTALSLAALVMASPRPVWAAEAHAKQPEPFRYEAGGRRDPFVPLVRDGRLVSAANGVPLEPSTPVLSGVLWDPKGQSIALIDDKEMKVGDRVADYRVLEIQQNSVVLGNDGGERMVLQITFEAAPSKPSSNASTNASTDVSKGGEGL